MIIIILQNQSYYFFKQIITVAGLKPDLLDVRLFYSFFKRVVAKLNSSQKRHHTVFIMVQIMSVLYLVNNLICNEKLNLISSSRSVCRKRIRNFISKVYINPYKRSMQLLLLFFFFQSIEVMKSLNLYPLNDSIIYHLVTGTRQSQLHLRIEIHHFFLQLSPYFFNLNQFVIASFQQIPSQKYTFSQLFVTLRIPCLSSPFLLFYLLYKYLLLISSKFFHNYSMRYLRQALLQISLLGRHLGQSLTES